MKILFDSPYKINMSRDLLFVKKVYFYTKILIVILDYQACMITYDIPLQLAQRGVVLDVAQLLVRHLRRARRQLQRLLGRGAARCGVQLWKIIFTHCSELLLD